MDKQNPKRPERFGQICLQTPAYDLMQLGRVCACVCMYCGIQDAQHLYLGKAYGGRDDATSMPSLCTNELRDTPGFIRLSSFR